METAGSLQPYSDTNILIVARKHWYAYLPPAILFFICLIVWLTIKFIALLGIIWCIHLVLKYQSTSWSLTDHELIIQKGYLPWTKSYYSIPIEDIYEAYYRHGLEAKLFKFGHLSIRRTDGTTTEFTERTMSHADELTGTVNAMVRQLKQQRYQPAQSINVQTNINITHSLIELAKLKERGILTDSEFEQAKRRTIGE